MGVSRKGGAHDTCQDATVTDARPHIRVRNLTRGTVVAMQMRIARDCLELRSGGAAASGTEVGDQLKLVPIGDGPRSGA